MIFYSYHKDCYNESCDKNVCTLMGTYPKTHVYWSTSVLIYFAVGAVLCSLMISVEWNAESYHALVIAYTLLGFILITAWVVMYCSDSKNPNIFSSTLICVSPHQDQEYGVVYGLSVNAALVSLIVTLIFWIWFLIYLDAAKNQPLQRVLEVYAVVFLPFTFFILLFYLASWWIPTAARQVCTPRYAHVQRHHHHHHYNHTEELTW